MKLISWNVNGLRACLTHDFAASFAALDADVFSVQETKMQPGQADFASEGYTEYTYSAEKKGYSGTACWCKTAPLSVTTGIGIEDLISIGTIGLIKAVNTFCPEKNIKLATYASRCIENEILMFLRKTSQYRSEISIDEPLNIDWDGNELLLSDVLGTDEDIVNRGIEAEAEKSVL